MKGCVIREASLSDVDEMTILLSDLFAIEKDFQASQEKQVAGLRMMVEQHDQRCVMIAEMNCEVVGMVTAQVLISTAEGGRVGLVEDMVVRKDFRGQGIGTGLLRAIEKWARIKKLRRLQLLADRDNFSALAFYKTMGWSLTQMICLRKK